MLTFDEMPDDNADLANVTVELPRLVPDGPQTCSVPITELLEYLALEVPDGDALTAEDLTFVRTARVGDADYWLWRFQEPGPDGEPAYATVSRIGDQVTLGYGTDYYGLSPEQYMLGDYHQVF